MKRTLMCLAAVGIAGAMALPSVAADAYIESSGAQAIDTGYFPNSKTKVVVDFQYTQLKAQSRVYGTMTSDAKYLTFNLYNAGQADNAGNLSWAFKDGTGNWTSSGTVAQKSRTLFVIDGVNSYYSVTTNDWTGAKYFARDYSTFNLAHATTAQYSLALFADHTDKGYAGDARYMSYMRLYSFQIWENDRLIHYYLPWKSGDDIGLKDVMTGQTFTSATATPFTCGGDITDDPQGDPLVLGAAHAFERAADVSLREGALSFTPGDGVELSVPAFGGTADVFVNDGSGGIVTFSPANRYTGDTYLMRGTLAGSRFIDNGPVGSLGAPGTFFVGPGTFRYSGPDGGVFCHDIASFDGWKEATTFDVQNDLTLTGEFFWEQGGFVKTGPGTLTLDRAGTHWVSRRGAGFPASVAGVRGVYDPKANGDSPSMGVCGFSILEGKVVVKSGTWHFTGGLGQAIKIGGTTVDPTNPNGGQEKSAVFQLDGGTVHFREWTALGSQNGYVTTTPDEVPSSGIIVNGGTLNVHKSLYAGRNFLLPKDATGNYIKPRTCPFVEVHGGTLKFYNHSRVGFCDDPGVDSRIFVDGGTLIVKNTCETTGSTMVFGSQSNGDLTAPRHADVTVCTNGIFDVTDFYITGGRTNVVVDLKILDGGIFRTNALRKGGTGDGCEMNLLVDGGVLELRVAGYTTWLRADLTSARIGTRGAIFRPCSGATANNIDTVNCSFTAADTHPGEVAQGVTFTTAKSGKNAGFRFVVPQYWNGPTLVADEGVCELAATGALPTGTDLTVSGGGRLVVAGESQTVDSLTFGVDGVSGAATLNLLTNRTITATAFALGAGTTVAFNLFSAMTANTAALASGTALAAAGTYPLLVGPASEAANLSAIASRATWANAPTEGFSYSFDVTTEGDVATLVLTVAAAGQDEPAGLVSPLDLVVPTDDGVTAIVTAADTAGKRSVTTNPSASGGGTVVLGDTLAGFTGPLMAGSGLTTISDLSFAAANPTWLTLGPGTLHYTGDDATVAGLFINAGAGHGGVLRVDDSLTLLGASTGTGSIMKKGAGDLILKGNGTFLLGNVDSAYSSGTDSAQGVGSLRDGVKANGDGPTSGVKNLMVSEGRLIIGTKGDDADAPTVTTGGFSVGHRSAVTQGAMETEGEIVMNNGTFTGAQLYFPFYCGLLASTPPGGLTQKITVNGGTFSVAGVSMGQDWQCNQTASSTLEVNGGEFNCRGTYTMGHQAATSGVDQVYKILVNGGTFTAKDIVVGNAAQSAAGEIHINDGGTLVVSNTFTLGKASTAKPQKLFLNAGGTLKTLREIAHTTGESYIYFRGGVWQPGLGRARGAGYTFGSSTAANQHTGVYLGAGGLTVDFTAHWEAPGVDSGTLTLRQPFLHDPDCAGEDGGITLRGHVTSVFRTEMNGSTFTGPVTAEEGFAIGVDNAWKGFKDKTIILKPSAGFRASDTYMYVNHLTMGEAGGTEPVVLDFCADREEIGLVVSNELAVLSPVTVAFHRPGGASNITGMQTGTYPVLIYPASLDDGGILGQFVANANFPEYAMTYAKSDVTDGAWAGWKQIAVTITAAGAAAGTTWLDGTTGGTWSDGAKWDGGIAPNGTNALPLFVEATAANVPVTLDSDVTAGTVTLQGATAESGYALSGGTINLNHKDFKTPPAITALTGTHTVNSDVTTDDFYRRSAETEANGGYTGSIGLCAQSNASLVVNGAISPDPQRSVIANPPVAGGGTVKFNGTLESGVGLTASSGTLDMDDATKLDGKTLTVKDGTFRFTGQDGYTTAKLVTTPSSDTQASIIRTDGDLVFAGQVNSTTGSLLKRGPGRLIFAYPGNASVTNRIGYNGGNTSWNSTGANWHWPKNGDNSKKQSCGALSIDEGEVVISGANALYHIANNGTARDCFIGANDRGWGYTTNYAALTIISGTVRGPWVYLGHTFNRGKDANGHLIPTYSCYNQYGGDVTFSAFCFGYDVSDYDTAVQATANLYGGTLKVMTTMRFGQTYNKTGINPPHATFNVYGGTYTHLDTTSTKGTRMGYLTNAADGGKTLNRGTDATLNMYGGLYDELERIHMGCNATTSRLNLHGGVLKAENIFLNDGTHDTGYAFYAGGKAYVYWNGGTYAPVGTAAADRTLAGLTEVLVSTNGAVVTTAELAGDAYTIAQPLLHDPALEGTDGGLVKKGAKPLALTGANTYTGDTVVEEGALTIPVGAGASALPAGSAIAVAEGATLEMAAGT
ncbi:MAG: hypothetical protein IJ658_04925, partial [Kiritimatiellae bacterium]|nr:hypothetical protein [Kiritimatiellia bacterium]